MGSDKIAAFYADPVKQQVDRASVSRSVVGRSVAVSRSPYWRARRGLSLLKRILRPDQTRLPARLANQATISPKTNMAARFSTIDIGVGGSLDAALDRGTTIKVMTT